MSKHTAHDTEVSGTVLTFEQMLHSPASQFKEPGRVPSGQWFLRCVGAKATENDDYEPGGNKPMGSIMFTHIPDRPGENVDTGAVEGGEWRGKRLFTRVNINDASDFYKARLIIEGHGVSTEGDRSTPELLELVRGRAVQATVGLRTYKNRAGDTVIENTLTNFQAAYGAPPHGRPPGRGQQTSPPRTPELCLQRKHFQLAHWSPCQCLPNSNS